MIAALKWDGKPLSEVKEGDFVPIGEFSVMSRTHPSQVHIWVKSGNLPYKDGKNGNRDTKLIKIISLAKMLPILKKCGMSDGKLEVLEAEGYDIDKKNSKMRRTIVRTEKKPASKSKGNRPGPKPKKKQVPADGSSLIGKYIDQSEKHGLKVKDYAAIIEEAIGVGIVAAV